MKRHSSQVARPSKSLRNHNFCYPETISTIRAITSVFIKHTLYMPSNESNTYGISLSLSLYPNLANNLQDMKAVSNPLDPCVNNARRGSRW